MTQREKAERLRSLHHAPDPLVLPNAWDAASARIFELEGFPAIGTTSAGIANSLGYADGQQLDSALMFKVMERIASTVDVPVTADVEAGYGDPVGTARRVIDTGAVGLNLEDYENGELIDIVRQAESISAIKDLGQASDVPLEINSRTEIYWAALGDPNTRFERTMERLSAYIEAGADCVFVPGVRDEDTIRRLVQALNFPLNVLATAGAPPIATMKALGVARVSVGSGPMRAILALTQKIARDLHQTGTYDSFTAATIPYADANRLFKTQTGKTHTD
jgi:2-methylisocitrate lyase-like PEP mutase family enzyme